MRGDSGSGRKRFLLPLPVALVVSYIILEGQHFAEGGAAFAAKAALITAGIGAAAFPVGLAWFVFPQHFLRTAWPAVSVAGYGLYLGLSFLGWKLTSRKILAVLILLLALNVASCQINAVSIQNTIGLE